MDIELVNVSKRFGDVAALQNVSLYVPDGTKVALIGPNGSGKSTLLRALMGMLHCEGVLRVGGRDPFTHRTRYAADMAYVPQTAPQLGASVREVVKAVAQLRGLDAKDIHAVAQALDLDIDAVARRPVRALSGGMKQKLLISLALAAPVSLLIMDEPTASLDAQARAAFVSLLEQRAGNATLLLSTHRLNGMQRIIDRVVSLEGGCVLPGAEEAA